MDQETVDKILIDLVDVSMGQLKKQDLIPADAEVTKLQSSQLADNNVLISIMWDTTMNTSYIICDSLDAVITTAKQMKSISNIFENHNLGFEGECESMDLPELIECVISDFKDALYMP